MSSFLVFNRLEIESVMLVFLSPLVKYVAPFPEVNVQYKQTLCGGEGGRGGGVELCCKPYSAIV